MDFEKLENILSAVQHVGDQVLLWRNEKAQRKILDETHFKTEADFKASVMLKSLIRDEVGESVSIISEEDSSLAQPRPELYWLIDPIDGTASWYNGFDGFVVQAALIVGGEPTVGIIYAPAQKKLWHSVRNRGAFLNQRKLTPLNTDQVVASRSIIDNYPKPQGLAKYIFEALNFERYIESGSIGLKAALVADGTADVFVKDVVFRDWDIAPAFVLVRELGGYISDLKGAPLNFHGKYERRNGLLVSRDERLGLEVLSCIGGISGTKNNE